MKLANNLISKDRPVTISIDLTNTGKRAGSEIVQLYISANESPIIRPPKELKNFIKVHLEPGETKPVDLQVSLSDLIHYDSRIHNWTYGVGTYTVRIGSSSRDIKFETLVACKP
ncbi:MAG: fibronectin type III-like domain-contianing protein [Candidatus Heimdallarchaeota archaeon]